MWNLYSLEKVARQGHEERLERARIFWELKRSRKPTSSRLAAGLEALEPGWTRLRTGKAPNL